MPCQHRCLPRLLCLALPVILALPLAMGLAPAQVAAASPPQHVFLVTMENYGAAYEVQQPAVQALMAKYGAAVNYSGVTNPSLPNYLALTSGQWAMDNFSQQCPGGQTGDYPTTAPFNVPNLFNQLQSAGISWGAYAEGYNLPTGWNYCTLEGNGYGFAGHHFPALYYSGVVSSPTMMSHLQPLTALESLLPGPAADVPAFTWVTPSVTDSRSLTWLTNFVSQVTASPAWQQNGTLIVTWDNQPTSYGTLPGFTQAPNTDSGGGNVLTLVISPRITPGTQFTQVLSHYSTLAAIETAFHLQLLGYAQAAPAWPALVGLINPPPSATALAAEAFSSIGPNPSVTYHGISLSAIGNGQVALAVFGNGLIAPVACTGAFTSITLAESGASGTFSFGGVPEGTFDATTGVATWTLSPTATPQLWAEFHLG